jgi:hypothetical protein
MKVVVDEGVPRQLVEALRQRGIDASRFLPGWAGISNGELLRALEEHGFDVLLTNDKNIASQQSLRGRRVAVVALPHNKCRTILERVDDIADALMSAKPGRHIVMMVGGTRIASWVEEGSSIWEELPPLPRFRFK